MTIASLVLSGILLGIILYAWMELRRIPLVSACTITTAFTGLYFVWLPAQANALAEVIGIGRGADLVLYLWTLISLLIVFNLHLKLRAQMELITALAREVALLRSEQPKLLRNDRAP